MKLKRVITGAFALVALCFSLVAQTNPLIPIGNTTVGNDLPNIQANFSALANQSGALQVSALPTGSACSVNEVVLLNTTNTLYRNTSGGATCTWAAYQASEIQIGGTSAPTSCPTGVTSFIWTGIVPNQRFSCVSGVPVPTLGSLTYGGIPLYNPVLGPPHSAAISGTGNMDVYTAPSCAPGTYGCNVQVVYMDVFCSGASGTITYTNQWKHGSSYWYAGNGPTGNGISNTFSCPGSAQGAVFYLNPGDTAALNVSAISGTYSATYGVLSYDSTTPLRGYYTTSFSTTATAVYSPSTQAKAAGIIVGATGMPTRISGIITLNIDSTVTNGTTFDIYVSPTSANPVLNASTQIYHTVAPGAVLSGSQPIASAIPVGYSIYVVSSAPITSGALLWFVATEF